MRAEKTKWWIISRKYMQLKVENLNPQEVGRGVARLSKNVMEKLNLNPRDVVEVRGKSVTGVRLWADRKSRNTVRLDEYKRRSAGVEIGDFVEIEKTLCAEAKRVVLRLADEIETEKIASFRLPLMDINEYLKRSLIGVPVVESELIPVSFYSLSLGFQKIGQTAVVFQVAETEPRGPVVVGENTEVVFRARKR